MVELPRSAVVAILSRAPSSGGKQRLFAAIGRPPDPALLSALLLDTLDGVRQSGLRCVVAVEPAEAAAEVAALVPADVAVVGQGGGTLGDRMRTTMGDLLASGASTVVLIGSDLPDLAGEAIVRATSILVDDPASIVLGPALDGGYYLIAATHVPDLFDGIEWGSPNVLASTRVLASRQGLRLHLLDPLRDVDTLEDLRKVTAPRTRAWARGTLSGE